MQGSYLPSRRGLIGPIKRCINVGLRMLTVSLFLGLSLAGGKVEKGDAIVQAQFDLMKLSYTCDDPLYRTKRETTRSWIMRLDRDTTFQMNDAADLDSGLKNGTVKLDKPINKGDCISLLADAQGKVDDLVEAYGR
jgi:hypothetical protein